jgi:hypothetical protein
MSARKLLESHGRFDVVAESLTDRTKVYSVVFPSEDGGEVVLACCDCAAAVAIAKTLHGRVIDVSTREVA